MPPKVSPKLIEMAEESAKLAAESGTENWPTLEELEQEFAERDAILDAIFAKYGSAIRGRLRDEYALVPRARWDVMKTWPGILHRAAQVAPFTMPMNARKSLRETWLWITEGEGKDL